MSGAQVNNYSEIISRIEKNLAGGNGTAIDVSASKQIAEASGESDEKERPASGKNAVAAAIEESLARDEE